MNVDQMSDGQLKRLARDLHDAIYGSQCFSSKDVLLHERALRELARRGFTIREERTLEILK